MNSSSEASAHWRSSKTMTSGYVSASRSKNSRHAANRSSRSRARALLEAEEVGEARLDPAPLLRVGDVLLDAAWSFAEGGRGSSPSTMPARLRTISASAQYVTPSP